MFHIRLLREEEAFVLLGGKHTPLRDVPEQADQTPLLPAFFPITILVAFFHVGEQWLKWLYRSSLMGSQMKPARAAEINWFILKLGLLWRPLLLGLQSVLEELHHFSARVLLSMLNERSVEGWDRGKSKG